jgi:hypothetical protein
MLASWVSRKAHGSAHSPMGFRVPPRKIPCGSNEEGAGAVACILCSTCFLLTPNLGLSEAEASSYGEHSGGGVPS